MDSLSQAFTDNIYRTDMIKNMETKFIGKDIIFLSVANSTNNIAKENCKYYQSGTVIIANYQEGGKGRRGKSWFSPEGKGLWFSIIIKNPVISREYLSLINGLIALSVRDAVLTFGIKLEIKWPNDLLLNRKKVCGILSEIKTIHKDIFLIAGIGINTGTIEFPEELRNIATSINLIEEKDREILLKIILKKIEEYYFILSEDGRDEIIRKWESYSTIGKADIYIKNRELPEKCEALKIGSYGELIVKDINGFTRSIYRGEEIIQKII